MTDRKRRSGFSRTWRVRRWIQLLSVLQAAGWVWLDLALGVRGDEGPLTWTFLAFSVLVVPFLALWPMVRLHEDGTILLRGWTATRRARLGDIVRLSMNPYGLRFDFVDGSSFTTVIFQATTHLRYPRVFDFVEAITGRRPSLDEWDPWMAASNAGIQFIPTPRPISERTSAPVAGTVRTMDALEGFTRDLVGSSAELSRSEVNGGEILTMHVKPSNRRARTIEVIGEQFLIVQIGNNGDRWELGYEDEDIALARALIEAAVAGHVSERFALGRSRVDVTFPDGTRDSATGYDGCLALLVPQPGWISWGRRVDYEPYGVAGGDS